MTNSGLLCSPSSYEKRHHEHVPRLCRSEMEGVYLECIVEFFPPFLSGHDVRDIRIEILLFEKKNHDHEKKNDDKMWSRKKSEWRTHIDLAFVSLDIS